MAMLHLLQVCQTPFLIIVAKQLGMFSKMSTGRNGLISCAVLVRYFMAHANQEIDAAVDEQRKLGMVFNQPAEVMVDLAEALVEKDRFRGLGCLRKKWIGLDYLGYQSGQRKNPA